MFNIEPSTWVSWAFTAVGMYGAYHAAKARTDARLESLEEDVEVLLKAKDTFSHALSQLSTDVGVVRALQTQHAQALRDGITRIESLISSLGARLDAAYYHDRRGDRDPYPPDRA